MTKSYSKSSIAYLTGFYARAGDTFIRREVEELRRLGWDVHTFSIRRADSSEQVSDDIRREQASTKYILEQSVWSLIRAFIAMTLKHPLRMLRSINQARQIRWPGLKALIWHFIYLIEAAYLAEQLIKNDIKLLHNHIAMNSGTVALFAATLADIPFSMTVHGPHEFFDSKHWGLGQKIAASGMTACISHFGKSQCMLFSRSEAWSKLHVVRCGLDRTFFDEIVPAPSDVRRLIYIGRLDPEKGLLVLLDAMARMRNRGIEFELVIVGDGTVRAEAEAFVEQSKLQETVQFVGWKGSQEVKHLLLESRALILTSYAEGLPVVLMEAMALQRPVIATHIAGIPELVEHGLNGWLVPASSVDDLMNVMCEALETPVETLAKMGNAGRARVMERHSIVTEVGKLNELFERLIEN